MLTQNEYQLAERLIKVLERIAKALEADPETAEGPPLNRIAVALEGNGDLDSGIENCLEIIAHGLEACFNEESDEIKSIRVSSV